MATLTSFMIAIGLAMDAFAVSVGIGTTGQARSPRPIFRLSFHFGLFQGLMTFLGWLAGSKIAALISGIDHWIALVLLVYVGANMIRSGFSADNETHPEDPSRGKTLLILCVATSIDAMAVGISMAMLGEEIFIPSLIIGIVTLVLSLVGLLGGTFLGERFGKRMEILGGIILNGIGLRIVLTHLL